MLERKESDRKIIKINRSLFNYIKKDNSYEIKQNALAKDLLDRKYK